MYERQSAVFEAVRLGNNWCEYFRVPSADAYRLSKHLHRSTAVSDGLTLLAIATLVGGAATIGMAVAGSDTAVRLTRLFVPAGGVVLGANIILVQLAVDIREHRLRHIGYYARQEQALHALIDQTSHYSA